MTLSIELPPPLDEELAIEAEREGVSVSDQAALLLHLMTALTREGRKTPFRSVIRAFLQRNAIDADQMAKVCEALVILCLHDTDQLPKPNDHGSDTDRDWIGADQARSLLRMWKSADVHQSVDTDIDVILSGLPALDELIQRSGRVQRPSAMGKYSWLKTSSEDYAIEKQREIEREDRRR
jgi:hypothetical protein